MAGGIFDNVWDPYSGAFAYPGAQPRPRYYRPQAPVRAPVRDPYGPVAEPVKTAKAVRTIPVTDGNEKVSLAPPVVSRFRSDSDAATKIQAVYRGHAARKTQPLQHLRVIAQVKEELASLKGRLGEREQEEKLRRDPQERLRWVEGVMALLLRLDSLQGVHPDVRSVRKSVAKEVIGFQETIDSMSSGPSGAGDGSNGAEGIENDGVSSALLEGMDVEPPCACEEVCAGERECANGSEAVEDSSPKDAPDGAPQCHDQSGPLPGLVDESVMAAEAGLVPEPNAISAEPDAPSDAEVPMEVESKEQLVRVSSAHRTEECGQEEPVSTQNLAQISPPMDVQGNNEAASRGDRPAEAAVAREDNTAENDASEGPVQHGSEAEMRDQAHETAVSQCGAIGVTGDNPYSASADAEENETVSETTTDGCMVPVSSSMAMELQRESSQGGLNRNPAADKTTDRELLLQLVEENRRLRDVVGKVLQWGKQQSDAIRNLTDRIAQLEHEQQPTLLQGEDGVNGRKRVTNCVSPAEHLGRSRRRVDKGRRNRRYLGYVDSEDWLESADSDEYF